MEQEEVVEVALGGHRIVLTLVHGEVKVASPLPVSVNNVAVNGEKNGKKRKRVEDVEDEGNAQGPGTRRRRVASSSRKRTKRSDEKNPQDEEEEEEENEGDTQKTEDYGDAEKGTEKEMEVERAGQVQRNSEKCLDILQLPVEMQQYIFSWLPIQTAAKLNLVCKQWRAIIQDQVWWQTAFNRHFGIPSFLKLNWKERCVVVDRAHHSYLKEGPLSDRLTWACGHGFWKILDKVVTDNLLEKREDINIVARICSSEGNMETFQALAGSSVKWNIPDRYGKLPLHYASIHGNVRVIEFLLVQGTGVDIQTPTGNTPLMFASRVGHTMAVKTLLAHGAVVDIKNSKGGTALHLASYNGHREIVKMLIDHNADVNTLTQSGSSALIYAAENGHTGVVKLLLSHSANTATKTSVGCTALSLAAQKGHKDAVLLLLSHGADVNTPTNKGNTALIFAAWKGHKEVVEILLSHGADKNARNHQEDTAIAKAKEGGFTDIVALLNDDDSDV